MFLKRYASGAELWSPWWNPESAARAHLWHGKTPWIFDVMYGIYGIYGIDIVILIVYIYMSCMHSMIYLSSTISSLRSCPGDCLCLDQVDGNLFPRMIQLDTTNEPPDGIYRIFSWPGVPYWGYWIWRGWEQEVVKLDSCSICVWVLILKPRAYIDELWLILGN